MTTELNYLKVGGATDVAQPINSASTGAENTTENETKVKTN